MSHRPFIFLGPSLSLSEARVIVDAEFQPPVRAADLEAVPSGSVVGIVDGELGTLRLNPSEAIRALNRGVQLYGTASTGALLAAQLGDAGFIGSGQVFELVVRHPQAAEDLIMVLYADHDHSLITEPLVNAVLAFIDHQHQSDTGIIDRVIEALRTIPIEMRTPYALENCLRDLVPVINPVSCPLSLRNYKAEDARLLLRHLARPLST